MEHEKLLHLSDVERTIRLKKSKIYNMIASGEFPRPVRLGKRAVRWRESDIQHWISKLPSTEVTA